MHYKLTVPEVDRQVPRARQVAALGQRLLQASILWLVGLPGAGKTSTAAQWVQAARANGERIAWWRLDEDDADIAGLLDALLHHPEHGAPGRLPAWSPDNQPDLHRFGRRFFGELAQGDGPFTLVLDDCHRLPDSAALWELLDAARDAAGPKLRFLCISRRPPPPLLARGVLSGWLALYDDLGLTLEEAAAVAEQTSGRPWSPAEVQALSAAQGWMAHVLALARGGHAQLGGATETQVGSFLCHELLLMLPAPERRGFRLLAELPEVPRALAGLPVSAARLLDQLAARRYFVDLTRGDAWRLHDLLRDGLRAANADGEPAAALAEARRLLAAQVLPHSPDAAMNLLVAAHDLPGALTLLRDQGRRWLGQGRHVQMLAWLQALPGAQRDAEALLWWAEAALPGAPEEARPLFARARAAMQAAGIAEGAYRAWCGEVASYVVQWGAVHGLAELVDELEQLEAALGPAPAEWRFRTAADALTALMYGRAEDPRIRRYAEATAQAVQQAPDAASRISAAAQLLIYRLWWAGDFPGGRMLYEAFDEEVSAAEDLPPLVRLLWWSNAAIVDWQCGDPARCHHKVERGLALAEASGVHVRDFFLLTQGIFCALSQENWPRAEAYLAQLARTEQSHKRLDTMVHHFFRSWYALSRGDAPLALAHAQAALPMAESMGSLFHKVIVLSALAPAALHAGDLETAAQAYRQQLALAKGSQNPTFAYIAFCAGAEIALVGGDEAGLFKQVERMLTVKQLGGFHSDCGWRTPLRARLMAVALNQGLLPEVARQWVMEKQLPLPADAPPAVALSWPRPVQITAIGGLSVRVNGQSPEATKPARALRELLAMLVARREGLPQSQLCDALWPDAEGDRAQVSLKAAVHRLRGWLGHDAVVVRGGLVALNPQRVGCDLWQQLEQAPQALARSAAVVLVGCDSPPVAALRQALQRGVLG